MWINAYIVLAISTLILGSESDEIKIKGLTTRLREEMGKKHLDYTEIGRIESELARHGVHATRLGASSIKEKGKGKK